MLSFIPAFPNNSLALKCDNVAGNANVISFVTFALSDNTNARIVEAVKCCGLLHAAKIAAFVSPFVPFCCNHC
ncbi:hypothetical protein J6P11_04895 [bacterium]|nr:hypothetical protein [bacterium]